MSTITTPLAAARAKFAEYAADRAVRPRAVCAVCGGIVAAGTGVTDGEPTAAALNIDARRRRESLPALHGWTRMHTGCNDPVAVVRTLTGLSVNDTIAQDALWAVQPPRLVGDDGRPLPQVAPVFACRFAELSSASAWAGGAWKHVKETSRDALAEAVRDAEHQRYFDTEAHRCTDGPCGACGVALSRGWRQSPIRWKDGAPAPWCAECAQVADRRPASREILRLRAVALEALSGASGADMSVRYGEHMRLFAELVDPGHPGTAERWEYAADTWAEVRESARLNYPSSLPDGLRQDYQARVNEIRRTAIAEQRALEEAEARQADADRGWPI